MVSRQRPASLGPRIENGPQTQRWLTLKQARDAGGHAGNGQKMTQVACAGTFRPKVG
ncbi:ArdC-like ssDNA-binding domain-containing protein [Aureimonas frigidaquae]|uniref:ArdC-like ssDNA-binding domain-containing protein n=1 Tax=Aureimonas frigidaquae TaxID=424757 RepID=UPI0038993EFD